MAPESTPSDHMTDLGDGSTSGVDTDLGDGSMSEEETPSVAASTGLPVARLIAIGVSAVVVLVVGLAVAWARGAEEPSSGVSIELPRPIATPDVVLTDTDGAAFHLPSATAGRITLLYFGYLNCPDACPIHMAVLSGVMRRLPVDVAAEIQVVFITTDPERDDPASLREYLDRFDPTFIGLTGSDAALAEAQIAAGLPIAVREPADERGEYLVGHATQVLVFERDGIARVAYPFGVRQSDWAADLPRLVRQSTESSSSITVSGAMVAETPVGFAAAVYLAIEQRGGADRLIGAASPVAGQVSLHLMEPMPGGGLMLPTDEIEIPAGGTVSMEPFGSHVMLEDLREPLTPGREVLLTLEFERHDQVEVLVEVIDLERLAELAEQ